MHKSMYQLLKFLTDWLIRLIDPNHCIDWDQYNEAVFVKNVPLSFKTHYGNVVGVNQTMPLSVYCLKTKTKTLFCSLKHKVICKGNEEKFVCDLTTDDFVITNTGLEQVVSVINMNTKARMYDLQMDSGHVYFADGILSHNSYSAMVYALEKCLQKPNQTVIYSAPTHKQVEGIAFKNLKQILSTCPEEILPHKSRDEMFFKNGSNLILAGLHNRGDRLRGKTANCIVIDEARDIPAEDFEYIIHSIITPILTTTGGQLVIVTTPPASADHPLCTELIPKAIILKSFYVAKYTENPLIEPDFFRELQDQDKGPNSTMHFKREYLADYTTSDATRLVIPAFDYEEQIARLDEYMKVKSADHELDPWIGIDIGVRAKTALVFGTFDRMRNVLVIVGERILSNPATKEIIGSLMDGEKSYFKSQLLEAQRVSDIDLLFINDVRREFGLHIRQVIKEDKISMIARLNESVRTGRTIIDVKACPYLSAQLKGGLWNTKRTDYEASADGSHLDAIDALKYLDMTIIRTAYNKPKQVTYGKTPYINVPSVKRQDTLPLDHMRSLPGLKGW